MDQKILDEGLAIATVLIESKLAGRNGREMSEGIQTLVVMSASILAHDFINIENTNAQAVPKFEDYCKDFMSLVKNIVDHLDIASENTRVIRPTDINDLLN